MGMFTDDDAKPVLLSEVHASLESRYSALEKKCSRLEAGVNNLFSAAAAAFAESVNDTWIDLVIEKRTNKPDTEVRNVYFKTAMDLRIDAARFDSLFAGLISFGWDEPFVKKTIVDLARLQGLISVVDPVRGRYAAIKKYTGTVMKARTHD